MKAILLNCAFLLFAIAMNAQHPTMYVADIFNPSWIQDHKIESISSQVLVRKSKENLQFNHLKKDHFHFIKGIRISKSANSVKKEGWVIREKLGRNDMLTNTYQLGVDNCLLEYYNMNDAVHTYYFYHDDGSIHYTVVDVTPLIDLAIAKEVGMTMYQFLEYQRDAEGKVVKKIQYTCPQSLKDIRTDLAALKRQSLQVNQVWEYTYDDQNRLELVKVDHKKPRGQERLIEFLTLKYNEQNLPIEMTHYSGTGNRTPSEIATIRKLEYTQL